MERVFPPGAKLGVECVAPGMENTLNSNPRVLTIEHSNQQIGRFLGLLKSQTVQVVVDTRSQPHSEYACQFDQMPPKQPFEGESIRYAFPGRELRRRPEGDEFYDDQGHVLHDRGAETDLFRPGLSRLEKGTGDYKVAKLCAAENPTACHRRLLAGRVLLDRGIQVAHIRRHGRIQTEHEIASETDPNRDQLALLEKVEAEAWKSIPSVLRTKRQTSSSVF
jgi:hypothetical protein